MKRYWKLLIAMILITAGIATVVYAAGGGGHGESGIEFPRSLESYDDAHLKGDIVAILSHRISQEPFNLIATLIFLCAIVHTFLTSKFLAIAHHWHHDHEHLKKEGKVDKNSVHHGAELFHFLGEVEAVFGIWAVALGIAISVFHDWHTVIEYIGHKVNYTEPMFVVIIMTLASTRPVLKFSETIMEKIANVMGGTLAAWWLTILTFGPLLGSFITEPAAMTIAALLLGTKFYDLKPSETFKYATIGLLFVNVSVGGTLTHFAAPPVLMVAGPWEWGMGFMMVNFGWKAALGIVIANAIYFYVFKKELEELQSKFAVVRLKDEIAKKHVDTRELEDEFDRTEYIVSEELGFPSAYDKKTEEIKARLKGKLEGKLASLEVDKDAVMSAFYERFEDEKMKEMKKTLPGLLPEGQRPPYRDPDWDVREDPVPAWVIIIHIFFLAWTVVNAHYPAMFIGGFLFFLGFAQVTSPYQNRVNLKPALLVGFFLAGLVIHGGMQGWWIAPVLGSLSELPLMIGATILTAFNDNAAITYLSTLVPGFTAELKYAVVAGAVTGGGLTVIANAPNPAGQSILSRYFEDGVSPMRLLKSALVPTIVMGLAFMLLRF